MSLPPGFTSQSPTAPPTSPSKGISRERRREQTIIIPPVCFSSLFYIFNLFRVMRRLSRVPPSKRLPASLQAPSSRVLSDIRVLFAPLPVCVVCVLIRVTASILNSGFPGGMNLNEREAAHQPTQSSGPRKPPALVLPQISVSVHTVAVHVRGSFKSSGCSVPRGPFVGSRREEEKNTTIFGVRPPPPLDGGAEQQKNGKKEKKQEKGRSKKKKKR